MKKVLITGGSGLVGSSLTEVLLEQGYEVSHLGRTPKKKGNVVTYKWDYKENYIDKEAFEEVDYIINLAGANVGDGRWTASRKKEIYDSRVLSTQLLFETVRDNNISLKKIISASAVGFYPDSNELMTENMPAGEGFLADVCKNWEEKAHQFESLNIPVTIVRIGIVLSPKGGFADEMAKPIKLGFGAPLGNGKQLISWIHIDDLAAIFLKALEEEGFTGIYNGVSSTPASNAAITKEIASILKKPLWLPNVPAFALKILFGEFSYELLVKHNISAEKLKTSGFKFKYDDLNNALTSVLK
jgi:hypothetical protein